MSPTTEVPDPEEEDTRVVRGKVSLQVISFYAEVNIEVRRAPAAAVELGVLRPAALLATDSLLLADSTMALATISNGSIPVTAVMEPVVVNNAFDLFTVLRLPSAGGSTPFVEGAGPVAEGAGAEVDNRLFAEFSVFLLAFFFVSRGPRVRYHPPY